MSEKEFQSLQNESEEKRLLLEEYRKLDREFKGVVAKLINVKKENFSTLSYSIMRRFYHSKKARLKEKMHRTKNKIERRWPGTFGKV